LIQASNRGTHGAAKSAPLTPELARGALLESLESRGRRKNGGASLQGFYARRTLRIFAPYFYAAVVLLYYFLLSRSIVWPQPPRISA
jgi:hypothetical protein